MDSYGERVLMVVGITIFVAVFVFITGGYILGLAWFVIAVGILFGPGWLKDRKEKAEPKKA
jgi:hypothetical protein